MKKVKQERVNKEIRGGRSRKMRRSKAGPDETLLCRMPPGMFHGVKA